VSGSGLSVVSGAVDGYTAQSGSFFALLGAVGNSSVLSQQLLVSAGLQYNLSLFLAADGGAPSGFSAAYQFSSQQPVTAFALLNPPSSAYQLYTTIILAPAGTGQVNMTLQLLSRDDPGYLALDSVQLVQVA
jgi:hypothetical protein